MTCSFVDCDDYTARWARAESSFAYRRVELSDSDPEFKAVIQNVAHMGGQMFKSKVEKVGDKNAATVCILSE